MASGSINSFTTNKATAIEAYAYWSTEYKNWNNYSMTLTVYCHVDNWGSTHTRDVSYEWYVNDGQVAIGTSSITADGQDYKLFTVSFDITTDNNGYWDGWMYGSVSYASSGSGTLKAEVPSDNPVSNLKAGVAHYYVYYYTGYGDNTLYNTQGPFDNGETCNIIDDSPSRSSSSSNSNFTITGDKNGGDANSTSKAIVTTTTNYVFKGWSKQNKASTAEYTSTSTINMTGDVTLYGVWNISTSKKYSGNTIGDLVPALPTKKSTGNFYNITLIPNNGQESSIIEAGAVTSYTFKGWAASATSTTILDNSTSYTSDTTVYAVWESKSEDKSTINLNTLARATDTVATYTIRLNANGGTVNPPIVNTSKTRSYKFEGWSTVNGDISYKVNNQYTPTNKADHSLYGIWTETETTGSIQLPIPVYPSFKFLGWGINPNSTSYVNMLYIPEQEDVTLYAIYKASYSGEIYIWHNGAWHKTVIHLRHDDVFNSCINEM